jgi:LmbE family N-acetylglucosaminyl deacetylase
MILKCASAARVACVFMTDGGTSHKDLIDQDELRRLRKAEALEATAILGVAHGDVHFLDFPDGRLAACHAAAVEQVAGLLRRHKPEEVYVPYRRDGTPDHEATFRIVVDALSMLGRTTRILEYPVWFWNRWPWVPFRLVASREALSAFLGSVKAGFGLQLLREFRDGVFVGTVLERKRAALSQHRSQMTPLRPGTPWPTLPGISEGKFLECFFQEFEVFRSSSVSGTESLSRTQARTSAR